MHAAWMMGHGLRAWTDSRCDSVIELFRMKQRPEKREVTIISRRMPHHSRFSGYDRLVDYIEGHIISPPSQWTLPKKLAGRICSPLVKHSGCRWYHREGMITEMSAVRQWLSSRKRVFHFLYGENSFRYLGAMKAVDRQNRIVCTYHTPPEKFLDGIRKREFIKRLDALVVVSTMQMEMFSSLIDPERIYFVPHGVDVQYFRPVEKTGSADDVFRCLFVGSHLRDMDTLAESARILGEYAPHIMIRVITSPDYHVHFKGLGNVEVLSGVSDDQLLKYYQTADLFLLPLIECTANNGLLEAMSCGLPIISTDLQGVRDYVDERCAVLARRGEPEAFTEMVLAVAGDGEKRAAMAKASREQAHSFSWDVIAKKMCRLYDDLA